MFLFLFRAPCKINTTFTIKEAGYVSFICIWNHRTNINMYKDMKVIKARKPNTPLKNGSIIFSTFFQNYCFLQQVDQFLSLKSLDLFLAPRFSLLPSCRQTLESLFVSLAARFSPLDQRDLERLYSNLLQLPFCITTLPIVVNGLTSIFEQWLKLNVRIKILIKLFIMYFSF